MKKIIYQLLPRLWGRGKFSDWNDRAFGYFNTLGVDYLWFTGIPRHASGKDFVKGDPGCPYSVSDWLDTNPYLADDPTRRMEEFEAMVQRLHAAGLRILIDYIPNHVAADYEGPVEHWDFWDGDWTDTRKVNWAGPGTMEAMREVLRFWAGKGVDGFRCDMVELVPPECLRELIADIRAEFPGLLFVAETYQKENYRKYLDYAGFDLLYDKSGMYDILFAVSRGASARALTWNWQSLGDMQPRMLNFLENHDEVRLASGRFMGSARSSYASVAVSMLFNTASFMLYYGQEAGESAEESDNGRTSIFSWSSPRQLGDLCGYIYGERPLPEPEYGILVRYREFLQYAKIPAFAKGGCWDLCYCNDGRGGFDADRHFAFLRYEGDESWLVVCNFSDTDTLLSVSVPDEPCLPCRGAQADILVPARDAVVRKLS